MSGYRLDRLNFLVVDDNKHMRALVKTILFALGAKIVSEAVDGADALKALSHLTPDIVICDWNMSPLDGMDFVRLVRTGEDSPNPFVPVIMLTGHTETSRVVEARDAGVNEFLAKPISANGLYRRIRAIIENPRLYIKNKGYFGPDRRRRQVENFPMERRKADAEKEVGQSPSYERKKLNQDEVSALLDGGYG